MVLFLSLLVSEILLFVGFLVFFHDRRSVTNRIFLAYSCVIAIWSIVNYFSLAVVGPETLYFIRSVLSLAVPHVFLFFLFVINFPSANLMISRRSMSVIFVWMVTLMIFAQTPLVFSGASVSSSSVIPIPGVFMPYFSGSLILVSLLTFYAIFQKYRKSKGIEKKQWISIALGLTITYILLLTLVLLNVVVFNNTQFVQYSSLFILPLFLGITFAILRFRTFRVKVFATETLAFVLVVSSVWQILLAESLLQQVLQVIMTVIAVVFSILLIRSVLREVRQREELQILSAQLEKANEQLKILDKARADFITIASHQLRTPPATIKWYVASLLNGDFGELGADVRDQLMKTQATNNSLISLIEDLLNVSRIERGKLEFVFEPTNIVAITEITVEQLVPQAKMKKLSLVYERPTEVIPNLTADKEKLRQVINNIIDNAIKYTKEGQVRVEISKTPKDVLFKVIDTGKGVSPGQMKDIFGKYDRGKQAAKNSTGLGLGLYVAKVIIEQHNGRIWVESKGEGKGSTFIFSLPIKSKIKNTVFDLAKDQPRDKEITPA